MPIIGVLASGGLMPSAPTIGTATGADSSASITFTAPTWVGKGTGTVTYTATSSPGGFTGTATSSPVTVSGLSNGTAYTFTVKATTSYGVTGPSSAASNSVTPAQPYTSSWDWIAEATPTSAGFVTFSSLPSGYHEWKVIGKTKNSESIGYTQINGSSSSLYGEFAYFGNYSSNLGTAGNGVNSTQTRRFAVSNSSNASGSPMTIDIFGANSSTSLKPIMINSAYASTPSSFQMTFSNGQFGSSSTISSVTLASGNGPSAGSNWSDPTVFSIYGLKEGTAI
jgi:hypothetical protein